MKTIRTTGTISDTIELVNSNDEKLTIKFQFLPSVMLLKQYRNLQLELLESQKEGNDVDPSKVGNLVIKLFSTIFGADNTDKIVNFYKNRFEFMALDLYPYIQDEIIPKCQAMTKEVMRNHRKIFKK